MWHAREKRNAYTLLVGKPQGKRLHEIPNGRRESDVKIYPEEIRV
jgi:hypothetical protein